MSKQRYCRPNWARFVAFALAVSFSVCFAGESEAQYTTAFYGKNKVKYDNHDWQVYRSPHFEIYYYPEFEQELGRVVSYAESAYEKVSNDLKHEISFQIPLILYKTFSEFAQTNLFPIEIPEGVGAFAEPSRDRMVIPIDNPPDELQELFIHELTHIFEFDIVPRRIVGGGVPRWIDEGLATYMEGEVDALDLMTVRDAAINDEIPTLRDLNVGFSRTPYSFGASIFRFVEDRFGKEGIRQFLFALRRAIVGGVSGEVWEQAFRMSQEEFFREYKRWVKDKYKPFRDKEIPEDYSLDLSPNPLRGKYVAALSAASSPSKEMVAVMSVNRKEGEFDVILMSAKDGSIIKNLTPGYSGDYETIVGLSGEDTLVGRNLAWTPDGNNVVFFGKYRKRRALIIVDALSNKVVQRVELTLDRAVFPHVGPGGDWVYFTALRDGIGDVYRVNLETEELQNLTDDDFYDKFPAISPGGEWLYYSRRISGHDKIYRLKLEDHDNREQMTFGPFDDISPTFSDDGSTMYYTSNEDGGAFNIRAMNLETGDILQYTDVLGGNFSPSLIRDPETGKEQLLFTSYYKGNYGLYKLDMNEPVKEITADMIIRTEGDVIDFVPPVQHQVIAENKRGKRMLEKLFVEGAPPINVGVTSGGDFFGGSGITFGDVLNDHQFTFVAYSVREFRSFLGSYANRSGRLQYQLSGFDTTSFFFANLPLFTQQLFSRQDSLATIRQTGATVSAVYPLSRFRRFELSTGFIRQQTGFDDPTLNPDTNPLGIGFQPGQFDGFEQVLNQQFPNGNVLPLSVSFVQETTRFRNFGPVAGSTVLLGINVSPGGPFLSRQTFDVDARKYFQLSSASLFAMRFRGFYSAGDNPDIFWFGGNGDMRGFPFQSFVGNKAFFTNAELRIPMIDALLTPIGIFGPVRGTFFMNVGSAQYAGESFQLFSDDRRVSSLGNVCGPSGIAPCISEGFGLADGVASYGFGLFLNAFGLPIHVDWSKLTDFSSTAPDWELDFWIGFEF